MLAVAAGVCRCRSPRIGACPALVALVPAIASRAPGLADVGLNVGVLAFTLGPRVATTLVFGLMSAAGGDAG